MKQYSADLGVGSSAVKRWRARQQHTGTVQALSRPGLPRRIPREAQTALVALVQAQIAM